MIKFFDILDRESVDIFVWDIVVAGYQFNEFVFMFILCVVLLEFFNNRYLGRYECLEKKIDQRVFFVNLYV